MSFFGPSSRALRERAEIEKLLRKQRLKGILDPYKDVIRCYFLDNPEQTEYTLKFDSADYNIKKIRRGIKNSVWYEVIAVLPAIIIANVTIKPPKHILLESFPHAQETSP